MSYKTILVHLDKAMFANNHISLAAEIALANEAHLIGAAIVGVSTLKFHEARIDEKDPDLASHLEFLVERARHFVDDFESAMKKACLPSYEGRVVDGESDYAISIQARYCDLVIISQAASDKTHHVVLPDFSEFVVVHAGSPVLILPCNSQLNGIGKKVLIAWNGSDKATRAVSDAIPMLKRAEIVQIAIINIDPKSELLGENAGAEIALYLARHGVNVEVLPPRHASNVGMTLLSMTNEFSSDLLVMGGYGYSHLREIVLGSVTNTVLKKTNIPVLMSH